MGIRPVDAFVVLCDFCDEAMRKTYLTETNAQMDARLKSWTFSGGKCLCPECSMKIAASQCQPDVAVHE